MPISSNEAVCSTLEAARLLGMAVRSVQLMVDRGELQAWKTPGGHRRIVRASVDAWLARSVNQLPRSPAEAHGAGPAFKVLLIEDSKHFQNLISLLMQHNFPGVELQIADDGITGLAMVGRLMPDLLLVDLLLPGIDGAMLLASLRAHPEFSAIKPIVVTSLDEVERQVYAHALGGVPIIHKSRLVTELPALLATLLPAPACESST